MICKIVNKVQEYSQNLCIKLSLKCILNILIDTWKGMNQFLKICIGPEKTTSKTLHIFHFCSFHLIVHLLGSQSPWFEWVTWQPNVNRIYEIPKRSTYKVTVFRLHRKMKTFLSNSKSFRKNEHVIVTPQPSAMFFTLCKILTHHISFFRHQLRF